MEHHEYQEVVNPVTFSHPYPNIERVICLAVADTMFAAQLLADPQAALQGLPAALQLSSSEEQIVLSVSGATNLETFSARIYKHIAQRTDGDG
ncbi:MAG TPA: hypothetical protein VFS21_33015 [Roseiflexaceae bacterium]|nr:hypothetical protein [Roseiflexaceae bacterium]